MKTLIIGLSAILLSFGASANDTLSTKISQATVFLKGAQVYRETKTINIKKGITDLILKDVSPQMDPNHLQATAHGNFLILDVQRRTEYIAPSAQKPIVIPKKIQREIDALNDSMLFISFEKEQTTSRLATLNGEKNMILKNKLMLGGGKSDSLPVLQQAMAFYRSKLTEINKYIHVVKRQQHFTSRRETKLRARLNELNNYHLKMRKPNRQARTRHHIAVTVYSETATSGRIKANYLVQNAGWIPAYDLRADNIVDPMQVTYKAQVYQNTGENWDKVKMVLSTYNQNCFTSKPTIGVWRLDYKVIVPTQTLQTRSVQHSQNFASQEEMESFSKSGYANAPTAVSLGDMAQVKISDQKKTYQSIQNLTEISQSFSNVEFKIKLPYSVNSDGAHKLMVVTQEEVPANFYHYMLPRSNKNGFLLAKVADWESLNLLPGNANIYFNHTFVGQTNINPNTMNDTLELSLGRDMGIQSTRKKIKDEEKEVLLSKYTVKTMTFEIELRNNSKGAINLTLEDQIPITTNEDITIELVDAGGAAHVESTGKLEWKIDLKQGEKRKVKFTYSVKYDKDKEVV